MSSKPLFFKYINEHNWVAALTFLNTPENNELFTKDEFIQCNTLILVALANELTEKKQYSQAIHLYNQSLKFTPFNTDAFIGISTILKLNNKLEESRTNLLIALDHNPQNPQVLNELGNLSMFNANYEQAKTYYLQALDNNPNFMPTYFNLSKYYLLHNDYIKGFDLYEYRFKVSKYVKEDPLFIEKKWRNEPLDNKIIYIFAEQGFGDAIQFSRFIQPIKAQCEKLILCCKKPLENLFKDQNLADEYLQIEAGYPEFDYHMPLLSIPRLLKLRHQDISGKKYISANPQKAAHWKERIVHKDKKNVGLVLQGSTEFALNELRSCPLDQIRDIFKIENIDFYSLQPELDPESMKDINNFHHFANEFEDFSETAAFIENLDLVVTVDSVIANLAGAMGKEVWILLYIPPAWQWGLEGNTSNWYDSAKLFRQERQNDWSSVINNVIEELKNIT